MKIITVTLAPNRAVLTCYLQDQSPKMPNAAIRPAMLVVPGGGYQYCSDREGEPVALAYMAQGFNAFVLRYTADATTPIDKALQDGAAAMDYLRANAAELEIDPQQIAAVGFSAGGHLVASLGTLLPKVQRPNALVLGYAATLGAMWTVAGRQEPDLHALVDDDTPPTFLFATQGDALVPVKNSLVFADALADHSIPFALHIFPTGAHGISLATACTSGPEASRVNPATAQWLPMSVDFLQKLWGCLGVTAPDTELAAQLAAGPLSLNMPVRRLMKNPQASALLQAVLGDMWQAIVSNPLSQGISLREISGFLQAALPESALNQLDAQLAKIPVE